MFDAFKSKYYDKIDAYRAAEDSAERLRRCKGKPGLPNAFDFDEFGRSGPWARFVSWLLTHQNTYWFFRTFFPVFRFKNVIYVWRYSDVEKVLEQSHNCRTPYGPEMKDLSSGTEFFLGMDRDDRYLQQLGYLRQAMDGDIDALRKRWVAEDPGAGCPANRDKERIRRKDDIETIIKPWTRSIATQLVQDSGGAIDAVYDLITPGAMEVCAIYYGLDLEDRDEFAEWSMAVSSLLFTDPFGNETTRRLALAGARKQRLVIDKSIARARNIVRRKIDDVVEQRWLNATLIGRLVQLQHANSSKGHEGPSDDEIATIIIGLVAAFVPTLTLTCSYVLDVLLSRKDAWNIAVDAASCDSADADERLEKCLVEAMRFRPPISPGLFRYAIEDFSLRAGTIFKRNIRIRNGDTVHIATASAMMDGREASLRHPRRFNPERDQHQEIMFGGHLHWCIGERIAKVVMTQMLKPLLSQKNLRREPPKLRLSQLRVGTLRKVGAFPRHLEMRFEPDNGHREQSQITIIAEVTNNRDDPRKIKESIKALGNPLRRPDHPADSDGNQLALAFDQINRVHFASLSAINISRDTADPELEGPEAPDDYMDQAVSHIFFELNVDGPVDTAIDAIVKGSGDILRRVFETACSIPDGDLATFLKHNVVQFDKISPFANRQLLFAGIPGHPVSEIEIEQDIECMARRELDTFLSQHGGDGSAAFRALKEVRKKLRDTYGNAFNDDRAREFNSYFVRSKRYAVPAASRPDLTQKRPLYETLWIISKPALTSWPAYAIFAGIALLFSILHIRIFKERELGGWFRENGGPLGFFDDQGIKDFFRSFVIAIPLAAVVILIAIGLFIWWYDRRDMRQWRFWRPLWRQWKINVFRGSGLILAVSLPIAGIHFLLSYLNFNQIDITNTGLSNTLAAGAIAAALVIFFGTAAARESWEPLTPRYWRPVAESSFVSFALFVAVVAIIALVTVAAWMLQTISINSDQTSCIRELQVVAGKAYVACSLSDVAAASIARAAMSGLLALLLAIGYYLWRAVFLTIAIVLTVLAHFVLRAERLDAPGAVLQVFLEASISGSFFALLLTLIAVLIQLQHGTSHWNRGNVRPRWNDALVNRLVLWFSIVGGCLTLLSMMLPKTWNFDAVADVLATFSGSLLYGTMWAATTVFGSIALFIVTFRRMEAADSVDTRAAPPEWLKYFDEVEDIPGQMQNHVLAVAPLKPDENVKRPLLSKFLRRISLTLGLWGVASLSKILLRPGFVLDMGTIHFARLFRLKNSDKLVFTSNFDGSWESYLEDFITKAHIGQTALWSNCIGFPETRFLLFDGAANGDAFKRWVRRQQMPTLSWYSRFPNLTTDRIRTNALIRDGLARASNDSEARAWVDLFSSTPRPPEALESPDIQSLLFGGLHTRMPEAIVVGLASKERDGQGLQKWIRDLISFQARETPGDPFHEPKGRISFGERISDKRMMILGLSAEGFKLLGLEQMGTLNSDGNALNSFPSAFRQGMKARNKVLGDGDFTEDWQHDIDAVLLIYADSKEELNAAINEEYRCWSKHGLDMVVNIPTKLITSETNKSAASGDSRSGFKQKFKEHFGFVDGISQPVIEGTRRFHEGIDKIHVVKPGEFILGYYNNHGYFPPTPVVADEDDPHCELPIAPHGLPDRYPSFGSRRQDVARDLGRNGSFLVIRQLEQDVEQFEKHTSDVAGALRGQHANADVSKVDAGWVGAKIVGRWQNGSSLVRYPNEPNKAYESTEPDNDFLFGADDPQGLKCPFGAHIRRANPRDSFRPGSEAQITISNRHRLLRVGRTYELDKKKGLLFMCLNADIERQFEFVQQTWIESPTFHGLRDENDPLLGKSGQTMTVPTPTGPVFLKDLKSFVSVLGGGYFFLPSRSALNFLASSAQPQKKATKKAENVESS